MKTLSFAFCSQWMHWTTQDPSPPVSVCVCRRFLFLDVKMQLYTGKVTLTSGKAMLVYVFLSFFDSTVGQQIERRSTGGSVPEAHCNVFVKVDHCLCCSLHACVKQVIRAQHRVQLFFLVCHGIQQCFRQMVIDLMNCSSR